MSIDAISSSSNPYQTNDTQTNILQIRKIFEQLGNDLQTGDLSGAQDAFSSLQQQLPSSFVNQSQTTQQNSQSTFSTDMNALGQALQSGDLSKAQDAFAKLQQDMKAVQKGHHHHHHHKANDSQSSVSSSNSSSDLSNVSSGDSLSGTNINVTT